jgi:uncharacterized protein (TIGR02246 family)
MKRVFGLIMLSIITGITIISCSPAQDKPAATTKQSPDEIAIRAASQSFAAAFEKGDAKAVAALWTEEGEYVDENREAVHGREALMKSYTDFFTKRAEVKVESKTDAIRFLGKDTAIEEGTFTVTAKDTPANSSRFSTLYVRQDGKWLIALLKEWSDDVTKKVTIQDLSWLIGTWESESDELKATSIYEWTPNQKFIRHQYTVTHKKEGEKPSSGVQVIGVDPASGVIRGWLFDSEGGIGESFWSWDDDHWVIDSTATMSDGDDTTAQNFLKRDGANGFTWRSVKRTINGESLPDINTVKVKRVSGGK